MSPGQAGEEGWSATATLEDSCGFGEGRLCPAGNRLETSHGDQDAWKTPPNITDYEKSCGFQRMWTKDVRKLLSLNQAAGQADWRNCKQTCGRAPCVEDGNKKHLKESGLWLV